MNVKGARDAQMGDDLAMEYDQERIFRHLYASHNSHDSLYNALDSYFYLDTPSNARKNDMSVTSRHADAIAKRFVEYIHTN